MEPKNKVRTIDIELAIFGLYDVRSHIIVPNVSNQMGLVLFETDMLVLTKANYATGFEIKVSKSDLLADKKKIQYNGFKDSENKELLQERFYQKKFKYFYYAVPKHLEEAALDMIPDFIGLYVFEKPDYPKYNKFTKVKDAKRLGSLPWSDKNRIELMRLGTMRIPGLLRTISVR